MDEWPTPSEIADTIEFIGERRAETYPGFDLSAGVDYMTYSNFVWSATNRKAKRQRCKARRRARLRARDLVEGKP